MTARVLTADDEYLELFNTCDQCKREVYFEDIELIIRIDLRLVADLCNDCRDELGIPSQRKDETMIDTPTLKNTDDVLERAAEPLWQQETVSWRTAPVPVVNNIVARAPAARPFRVLHGLGLLACVLAIIGSIGPWASVIVMLIGQVNRSGFDGDGRVTAALAVVAAFCYGWLWLKPSRSRWWSVLSALTFILIALTGIIDAGKLADVEESDFAIVSIGWGLYLVIAAGVFGLAVSLAGILDRE